MAKRYYGSGMYDGMDERRRQERADGMMLSEDHSAIANMPQSVVYRAYPQAPYASYPYLDDTIGGIDHQMREDGRGMKKKERPEKY